MSDMFTKNEEAGSGSPKVLAAICIVVLIAVVSIVVLLRRDGAGPRQERPQEDTTKEPEPKPLQPEERGDRQPEAGNVTTNSIGMKLVYIPAGSFMMGSGDSAAQLAKEYDTEEEEFAGEFPQHEVRISKGFWMGQAEVTQGRYRSIMNAEPWSGEGSVQEDANNPAMWVTWDDANDFCAKLSRQEGKTYRLPTEAEWEYACRAGTKTRFSFGDSDSSIGDYAWFHGNAEKVGHDYTHTVGQKKPNPWGLYDMHGNVWEWCSDFSDFDRDYYSNSPSVDPKGPPTGFFRGLRGGSWLDPDHALRSSYRCYLPDHPEERDPCVGFRVVRSQ